MDPREELQALRRMAELEAKASGAAVTPIDTTPQWGRENPNLFKAAQATRQYLGPTLEAGSAIAGAALGTAVAPGVGTVGGAGLGYGIGTGITKMADVALGNVPPETAPQALTRGAKDVLTGATLEAGGAAAGKVLSKAAKAAGWVWDAFSGKLVNVRAGKTAREIAGADLGTIKDLASGGAQPTLTAEQVARRAALGYASPVNPAIAPSNLTAAQATQASGNNVLAALGEKAAKNDVTNFFSRTAAEQEAARQVTLRSVTPDLATVTGARAAGAAIEYPAAKAGPAIAPTPVLQDIFSRPTMKEVLAVARRIAGDAGTPFGIGGVSGTTVGGTVGAGGFKAAKTVVPEVAPSYSVSDLHNVKMAMDKIIANPSSFGIDAAKVSAIKDLKKTFLSEFEAQAPAYGAAREAYAARSAPVDQSRVLGAMQDVLAKPGGGERVVPFLNVLGTGENALIKRAGGDPRFGGLEEVLTPKQMGAVNDIAGQFTRDLALAQSAAAGRGGLSRVLRETSSSAELPPSINLYTRSVNKVLSLVEGRVNVDTRNVLEKGMRSGKDLLTVLNTLPSGERIAALQALGQTPGKQLGRAAVYGANALAPQNQNALAP